MAKREVSTFCRVCEPACGLVASVEDGELVRLRPDRDHPITRGFACHKGMAGLDIHLDSDRLDHPLRRAADGSLSQAAWDDVVPEIAERLSAIVAEHGPESVAAYIGNPTAFNSLAAPATGAFFAQLGNKRMFSSGTQDCANKFTGSEAVFGSSTVHPVPDLEHTDYLLIFGENPRVSHMSFFAIADPMAELKAASKRGTKIRYVNPREIESAGPGTGDVVLIHPDTDLYLLAALLHTIDRERGFDAAAVRDHASHVEELRAFLSGYSAEKVASVVGLSADAIRTLALEFADAGRASVHMSTGVNMGRQGTLAYWLLHMLSLLTGNLDVRGGNVLSVGFYASAKAGRRDFDDSFVETDYGRIRKGALPGNLLAQHIEDPEKPVRALIVVAGNPVLSIGGGERLRKAIESLDLLICIDLYSNATGEFADYLLPSTDMFERADVNLTGLGLQHRPYIQYTDACVEARGERREEWWIFGKLAQAMGFKSPLDAGDSPDLFGRIDHMLKTRGQSMEALRASPHQLIDFGPHEPGDFFTQHLQTDDQRVDCCPPGFAEALDRASTIFAELVAEPPDRLKLISRRDPYMHNSWYQNLPAMKRAGHDTNYLYVHPEDAKARGLADGGRVRVSNDNGELMTVLRFDTTLKPRVVAMTHGWGNGRTSGMRVARETPGTNANVLLPSGPGSFEPLSSQAHMTGIPVEVAAIPS